MKLSSRLKPKQFLYPVVFLMVAGLFVFLRWYKLDSSLLFYNDMGRDFVVLLNWRETGKPPLLGPQTSVMSYNQSAWYFYLLYPFFLLTGQWAFSSTLALTVVALVIYGFLAYQTRKNCNAFFAVSLTMFLLAIHPQAIFQNRFIWNPSFVPYFLLLALSAILLLKNTFTTMWLGIFWLGIAFAVGFSYSAVPLALVLFVFLLLNHRQHWLKILSFGFAAAPIVLLPMLAFEIRHNFALTQLFLNGQTTPQTEISFDIKSTELRQFLFANISLTKIKLLVVGFAATIGFSLYFFKKNQQKSQFTILAAFSLVLVAVIASMYLLPVNIEKHYIFPLLTLGFFVLSLAHKKAAIIVAAIAVFFWLSAPNGTQAEFYQPAVRTVAEMEACYRQFCQNYQDPAYVSMESGVMAGYHNAPEHQFFLRKFGCQILDIETSQNAADTMLVIEDSGNFDPGKAGYRELTLFGPYTLGTNQKCTQNLSVVEIKKANNETSTDSVFQPQ